MGSDGGCGCRRGRRGVFVVKGNGIDRQLGGIGVDELLPLDAKTPIRDAIKDMVNHAATIAVDQVVFGAPTLDVGAPQANLIGPFDGIEALAAITELLVLLDGIAPQALGAVTGDAGSGAQIAHFVMPNPGAALGRYD